MGAESVAVDSNRLFEKLGFEGQKILVNLWEIVETSSGSQGKDRNWLAFDHIGQLVLRVTNCPDEGVFGLEGDVFCPWCCCRGNRFVWWKPPEGSPPGLIVWWEISALVCTVAVCELRPDSPTTCAAKGISSCEQMPGSKNQCTEVLGVQSARQVSTVLRL